MRQATIEPPQPVSLDVTAGVQDVNKQTWSSTVSGVMVLPSDFHVGLKLKTKASCTLYNGEGNVRLDDAEGLRRPNGPENGSHSKRSAALNSRKLNLSFGYVMRLRPLLAIFKGGRQTRQTDAPSSL